MKSANQLKISLVDDHNLFRKGLIKLINMGNADNQYSILFEADNGRDLQEKMKNPPFPDIILMDIDMPDMNGFEAVEWLKRTHAEIKVMVISMVEDEKSVLRMLRLGVKGFLNKDIEVEDMHNALKTISNNGIYFSEIATNVMNLELNGQSKTISGITLSENERIFLKHTATDLTYQQIADQMNLSVKTIDGYRESLFKKCNVKSRTTLAVWAIKQGIVQI
ncbi:response regulator transcription factor [Terrimonas sp. NA20]|uniref:Response regulator transcription factor n=1 Tax=Terrimonas ginsenosidimutans TaxID=2908004 RepID=A0ABS9KK93_9BACT|nr:response regulator transcription factor [Terrimonas ginsenosidimutans]MCG2612748.1 response regulator transcription factor [Terrimonas ginsenosidimutans]